MNDFEHTYRLLEIPEYENQRVIYQLFLNEYQGILSAKMGCTLHFYLPPALIINEFPEKEYYPRKMEKLRECHSNLSSLLDELKEQVDNLNSLTNDLLAYQRLNVTFIEKFNTEAKKERPAQNIKNELDRFNLLRDDLWHHLPEFNVKLLLSSWKLEENKSPIQTFDSEGLPFRLGGQNSIHLPIIQDNRKELIVYVGYLPFRRAGRGYLDIWKKDANTWKMVYSRRTWMS